MPRTILVLTALLCSLSPVLAGLSPRPASCPSTIRLAPLDGPALARQAAPPGRGTGGLLRATQPRFRITSRTEITVDGHPCCYADVPKNATILKMEVDSDNGTIATIHFRSKK